VETIKRQAGTVRSCFAARMARECGLSLQPIDCTSALACDKQRYGSCSAASGAIQGDPKCKPPPIFQKIVLKIANEIRFLRKVKV